LFLSRKPTYVRSFSLCLFYLPRRLFFSQFTTCDFLSSLSILCRDLRRILFFFVSPLLLRLLFLDSVDQPLPFHTHPPPFPPFFVSGSISYAPRLFLVETSPISRKDTSFFSLRDRLSGSLSCSSSFLPLSFFLQRVLPLSGLLGLFRHEPRFTLPCRFDLCQL